MALTNDPKLGLLPPAGLWPEQQAQIRPSCDQGNCAPAPKSEPPCVVGWKLRAWKARSSGSMLSAPKGVTSGLLLTCASAARHTGGGWVGSPWPPAAHQALLRLIESLQHTKSTYVPCYAMHAPVIGFISESSFASIKKSCHRGIHSAGLAEGAVAELLIVR